MGTPSASTSPLRLLAAATLALAAARVEANDLASLYQLALSRDASLQASTFERDAAIEVGPQARAVLLPQLALTGSAARERVGFPGTQPASSQATDCTVGNDPVQSPCYGTSRALGVSLTQTLWNYQAYSALKEANLQAAAAEAHYRSAEQALLLRVAQAYFGILSASDQLTTNRSEREAFGSLLNQARVREQTGVGPRSDVSQAKAFFDASEQNVIDAANALDDAQLALTEIVGPHAANIAALREDIPLLAPDPASPEEWVRTARRENFDVLAADLRVQAAQRDIDVQGGKHLPTLAITGSSSRLTQDATLGGNQTLDMVAVSVSWPLFQGGAVASAVRQARALYREAVATFDAAGRDAERRTRAAYRGVVSGVERIAAARRAVESGREAVEASRRNIEFGRGTEFDLLNAQNNYYAAVRAYSQARYDYLTNLLTLKQQAGRLTVQDIGAIDDLLVVATP
jgi:outer membrane protein